MVVTQLSDAQACVKTTYDEQLAAEIASRRVRTQEHPDDQHAVKIPPRFGVTPQVEYLINRVRRKSLLWRHLGFCATVFCFLTTISELSAEQKPKHCQSRDFLHVWALLIKLRLISALN